MIIACLVIDRDRPGSLKVSPVVGT